MIERSDVLPALDDKSEDVVVLLPLPFFEGEDDGDDSGAVDDPFLDVLAEEGLVDGEYLGVKFTGLGLFAF
jgi:hypothetical protein